MTMSQEPKQKPALTRRDLDPARCSNPECDHSTHPQQDDLFLGGACHPGAPVHACYHKASGAMRFTCAVCGKGICAIAVAP